MAPFPLPHSDITFPSPFSKSRIRAWGPTICTYSVGLGERPCLPLKWCPKCVTGWLTLNKARFPSKLGLLKLKWGNARDTELFSFLPILGHLPQLYASLSGYSQPFCRVSTTQVLHLWGLLTWALGTGAWDRTTLGIGWAWEPWFWSLWSGGGW